MRRSLVGSGIGAAIRAVALAAIVLSGAAFGQSAGTAHPTITVPSFQLPYSSYASPEAIAMFERWRGEERLPPNATIPESRAFYDRANSDRVRRMRAIYDVNVVEARIGGVPVHRVTPKAGVAPENRGRVLINLHGGGFMWGAGSGELAEAVPIAAVGRIEVVTVDYRMAPEHRFPAASEDVAAVYRALLATHAAKSIGIYGCSAGGILTGQSVAWFLTHKIPVPGAIGTFCGTVVEFGGDSMYFGAASEGKTPGTGLRRIIDTPYFAGARADDPLAFPGVSRAMLSRFPPTLLITGTRDFAMSSVLRGNELLRAAGVKTELRVWDGMPHAFFVDPEPEESQQAYEAIVRFFHDNLAAARRPARRR